MAQGGRGPGTLLTPYHAISQCGPMQFLSVAQLLHFCRSRLLKLSREGQTNLFDELLQKFSQSHGISCLYNLLRHPLAKCKTKQIFTKWEKTLGDRNILKKYIICETWRKTYYKLIHNAIYGFNLPIKPRNPRCVTACLKCDTPSTDMWHCPAIQHYWKEVQEFVNEMCDVHLGLHADSLIFHCVRPPETSSGAPTTITTQVQSCATLVHIALLAANRCITNLWLSPASPIIPLLVTQIRSYLHMDRLTVERNPGDWGQGVLQEVETVHNTTPVSRGN